MSENAPNLPSRISHYFADNQPLSWLVVVAVVLFGLLAFFNTPKQYNPEITRPAFLVTLEYQGATKEAAVNRVVYELVEKIRTVPGVDEIRTTVRDGGHIESTVIFMVGHDTTRAKVDLWSELEQHEYRARGFIKTPTIQTIDPETIPVLQVAFSSAKRTPTELRDAVVRIGHTLGDVPHVSVVSVHGGVTQAAVVELQPERLTAAGVSPAQIRDALAQSQGRAVFAGLTTETNRIPITFTGAVDDISALGSIPVTNEVRIRDVARVYYGSVGDRSYVWHHAADQSGPVVMLGLAKQDGSSAPAVTSAARERLDELVQTEQYSDLSYQVVADNGVTATKEIVGLTQNLLTSIAIVATVLLLFLSTRAALVVLITIPLTLLIVFGLGWLFGETINRITLFALILSLGLLVDAAIVVVENIHAHLNRSICSGEAVLRSRVIAQAVHEVGPGLVLSTITSVIVFLPMAYITGMMGPYMGPIAFFVPAALLVALVVAIGLTPFLAGRVMKPTAHGNVRGSWFAAGLARVTHWYGVSLRRILAVRRYQRWILQGALGIFLVSLVLPLAGLVHFQMLPKADRDQVYIYVDAPPGTNIDRTRQLVDDIARHVVADPAVRDTQSFIGTAPIVDFNGLFKGAQSRHGDHQATLRVNFLPSAERERSSVILTQQLRDQIHVEFPSLAPYVRFMEEPPGPPVQATFVATLSADTPTTHAAAADALNELLRTVPGVTDRKISPDAAIGGTTYQFDHEAAATYQVSQAAVGDTLALLSGPVMVSEFRSSTQAELTPLLLALSHESRNAPSDVLQLPVRSTSGEVLPLATVVDSSTTLHPGPTYLDGNTPATQVTAAVTDRPIVYVMLEVMWRLGQGEVTSLHMQDWGLFGMTLVHQPTGETVTIDWGGEWEMTLENFRDLGMAMGVALTLVYGILVAQYRRFATPAFILVTVPLGLVGILWGFFLLDVGFGIYLTATALIGFIALIGIVVNNAIIYLEYVRQERYQNTSFAEALVRAGEARLRPILLTSLTTILGSLTIASDPVWSGLAWAIVFGLSLSTLLTLIIYPTLLMYFTGAHEASREEN